MRKPTWGEEIKRIKADLDLQRQKFVSDEQLLDWYNEAINLTEVYIHDLSEDYFLSDSLIPLVKNQKTYPLPENIFAGSIRRLSYDDRNNAYDLERIRRLSDIPSKAEECHDNFSYVVFNLEDEEPKIRLFPTPLKDDSTSLKIEYIRNAKRLIHDLPIAERLEQKIDIPEFTAYCRWYVICRCYIKEKQWQDYQIAKIERDELKTQMIQVLSRKEKDGQSQLIPDYNSYPVY